MRSRLTGSIVLDVPRAHSCSTSGIRCLVNIVPLNIKPLRCLETWGINRPVTWRHIPRERRTPQEITELWMCRMSCRVLMCKLPCCCVLLCKVPCSYFAQGVLPLYASKHAILVFCVCNFHILFVGTRTCFCVLCVCFHILVFMYLLMSLMCAYVCPFVNVLTKVIFFYCLTKCR
jgi:hypothetical protein